MRLKVQENERLVRDSASYAILNTDRSALSAHEQKMEQIRRVKSQEQEINSLKSDISEIKDLLKQLMTQRN
jgi:hypothetical protein